jgi:sec-independent protein translocase protein TatA
MSVGLLEILLLFVVFVALGPRRIANLFRSMGRGVHDFVDALGRDKDDEAKTLERGEAKDSSEARRDTGPD